MALFKPYKILKNQLENLPKKEGQLIFTIDTGEMYLDIRDNERVLIENSTNMDYSKLKNLPKINSVEIKSNLSLSDLGIKQTYTATDIHFSDGDNFQDKLDKGELSGKDGKNTVYVGDVAPADPDMLIWINPQGEAGGGTSGGTLNYNELQNKPKINNIEIQGNITLEQLKIKQDYTASDIKFTDGESFQTKYDQGELKGETGNSGGQGPQGDPGESAYQTAIKNGFKGSESEWLASLKGDPGDLSLYAKKAELDKKVDKIQGKELSENNYTTNEKNKLSKLHNTWVGTKSEYDAIVTKDNQTLYFIKQG